MGSGARYNTPPISTWETHIKPVRQNYTLGTNGILVDLKTHIHLFLPPSPPQTMDLKGDFHWRSRRRNIFAITALAIVATSALYLVHIPGDHEGLSCPLSIPDVKLPLVNGSVPERRILSDTAGGLRFRGVFRFQF
jgi:hypothetical protein